MKARYQRVNLSGFVLVSALQRGPGQVSSLKNKLSRAILVVFLDVYTYEFGVLLSFIVTGVKTSPSRVIGVF